MKKTLERLLVFIVGLPLISFLVVYFPYKNHLALNVFIVLLSSLGAVELAVMLKRKNLSLPLPEAAIIGAICPLSMTLVVSFGFEDVVIPVFFILGASWFLVSRVFAREDGFEKFAGYVTAGFSVLVYPGGFLSWIIMMARWPRANMVILVFILIVCINDSAAWAAGILLGKNNRGFIPASPNKSAAGYLGGFAASMLAGILAVLWLPGVFSSMRTSSLAGGAVLGFFLALTGSLGDLGESLMKRSTGMKDSGTLIPGRGGVLDTIDSIALAAPVYFCIYRFFFLP